MPAIREDLLSLIQGSKVGPKDDIKFFSNTKLALPSHGVERAILSRTLHLTVGVLPASNSAQKWADRVVVFSGFLVSILALCL